MALAPIAAVCPHCEGGFTAIPNRTFLGFQKLTCPECKGNVIFPLTSGYRTTYWVVFVFMVLGIFASFSEGGFAFPGGLGIAVVIALVRDSIIKKRVATVSAQQSAKPNASPNPDTHVKCPDCRELILKEARVCKHCGFRLIPQLAYQFHSLRVGVAGKL